MKNINIIIESEVEQEALNILENLNYEILSGPIISPDGIFPERDSYSEVILKKRLEDAIDNINPQIPPEGKLEAIKKVYRSQSQSLISNNKDFHEMLINGIDVEFKRSDGSIKGDKVWLIDFNNPENNNFLAVNQFSVIENDVQRRPDIVIFINGIPLALIELKNPFGQKVTIKEAFNQIETYKYQIPSVFKYNEIVLISDGVDARAGTITSDFERYMPWKTVDGKNIVSSNLPLMKVLLQGMFDKKILLDLIRHFIVYEVDNQNISKNLLHIISTIQQTRQ